nr:gamma-glutamyl-gamma-aminobutyrate hydrolase family protein [Winslowiella toletana]
MHDQQQLLLEYALQPTAPRQNRALPLGVVGREADHRQACPATLAALDHAAIALDLGIEIRFLDAATLPADLHQLAGLAGVVLPGGASMAAVGGQIKLAAATLKSGLPTLGLCLGMQSMATAAVHLSEGYQQAMLAEVDPSAPLHSFIRFSDGRHRCGVLPFASTLLPAYLSRMHYNHRYHFNPALLPQLAASGVQISAETAGIVEAISQPDLPFWHGVQGHPELLSRPDAPHPLFTAFLQAAISQSA